MGMTMAEQVVVRASKADSLAAGEYVTAAVGRMMAHEAFGADAGHRLHALPGGGSASHSCFF
jgi:hypothetical protein